MVRNVLKDIKLTEANVELYFLLIGKQLGLWMSEFIYN